MPPSCSSRTHVRLAAAPPGADRTRIIVDACKEVGRPIFFSLLLITVSFLPIFTLAGQAGRLFMPLAYTKTFAMFAAAMLSITLAPPLMVLLLKGRFRTEATIPSAGCSRPSTGQLRCWSSVPDRRVVAAAVLLMIATVPTFQRLGSEFMPPLDEGSLLVMPTTFPGIAIEEARRALTAQNRIIMRFPEIASVHGKAGRAETATDPAQLDMIESVIALRPRSTGRRGIHLAGSTIAPDWAKRGLRRMWPEQQARTLAELSRDLDAARMPGYQMAIAPPIRTHRHADHGCPHAGRDGLGEDLKEIERVCRSKACCARCRARAARSPSGRPAASTSISSRTERRSPTVSRCAMSRTSWKRRLEACRSRRRSPDARASSTFAMRPTSDRIRRRFVAFSCQCRRQGSVADLGGANAGAGADAQANGMVASSAAGAGGGMGSMGGGGGQVGMRSGSAPTGLASPPMGGGPRADLMEQWRQPGAAVPLGELADVRVTTGPPMIKDENGVLVGYVFADIDQTQRDLGGWVDDAKTIVASQLALPAGYPVAVDGSV